MGLEYSVFNVIGSALDTKTTTETGDNGHIITSTHRNPWVSGAAVLGASAILVTYLDGGSGMVSRSLWKTCIEWKDKMKLKKSDESRGGR